MTTATETKTPETSSEGARRARVFEDSVAVREKVPLLLGLVGPSGGGKTYSALRLASGIQRVCGGDIFVIDTEGKRAKHYADRFRFRHVPFGSPFGPLEYLDAIEQQIAKGAGIVIVDSMSHEHEGPGGVLEMHDAETARLAKEWKTTREKVQMTAWSKPKAERRRLINSLLQMPCNFIFCFRAKNKLKIEKGKDPVQMGYMPIAGEEFVFEMTMNSLLLPNAGGVPTWHSDEIGERQMIKLPEQFRDLFIDENGEFLPKPFGEDHGEALAKWASGAPGTESLFAKHRARVDGAGTLLELQALWPSIEEIKKTKALPAAEYNALKRLFDERRKSFEDAAA